jgi:hypothetical protein
LDTNRARSGWILYPAFMLLVATLLTLCDALAHVRLQVLAYAEPAAGSLLPGQPTAAVFLGFLRLALACTGVAWLLFRRFAAPRLGQAVSATLVFVACYALSAVLQDHPMGLSAGALALWALRLPGPDACLRRYVLFSVLIGVAGPLVEGWSSSQGFFHYLRPDAYFVPVWLGGLYFNGALAIFASITTIEAWRQMGLQRAQQLRRTS